MDRVISIVKERPALTIGVIAAIIAVVAIVIVIIIYVKFWRTSNSSHADVANTVSSVDDESGFKSIAEVSAIPDQRMKTFIYPSIHSATLYTVAEARRFNAGRDEWKKLLIELRELNSMGQTEEFKRKAYINAAKMASIVSGIPPAEIIARWNERQGEIRDSNIDIIRLRSFKRENSHDRSMTVSATRKLRIAAMQAWRDITLKP